MLLPAGVVSWYFRLTHSNGEHGERVLAVGNGMTFRIISMDLRWNTGLLQPMNICHLP